MRQALLIVLAGCNQLYGLEGTDLIGPDAPVDAPGCSASPFVNPEMVEGSALDTNYDPSESAGGRELWLARNNGSNYDIVIATRAGNTGPFDTSSTFPHNSTTANDGDAALSGDGLVVMFISSRVGGQSVYESRRPRIGDPFSQPVPVATGGGDQGIDLSFDGLTLYYADGDRNLHSVHRPSRAQPFGPEGPVLASETVWPSVSPDELELVYQKVAGSGLYHRTRANPSVPFDDNETVVLSTGADPDFSSDSTRLYFDNGGIVFMMSRTCD